MSSLCPNAVRELSEEEVDYSVMREKMKRSSKYKGGMDINSMKNKNVTLLQKKTESGNNPISQFKIQDLASLSSVMY